ncbi:MAG: MBL fold metallo-hydrolase [Christensenellaceae bacterium]|jgi:beta-lactamase superfamily II metal-dependent hydrolase|nr:MBL fold metallo-hydrolase [Christensenellaceae bacterium]
MDKKRKSAKKRRSALFKLLVLLIILGFVTFVYCAQHNVQPLDAFRYLLGIVDKLPQLELAPTPSPTPGGPVFVSGDITAQDGLHAYVLDVGQGDCTFLRSPAGRTMLIDAGERGYYPAIAAFLRKQGVKKLDVVVATHPDSDHIGSMPDIIDNFEIGAFYMPDVENTTSTFESMLAALERRSGPTYAAYGGKDVSLDWDSTVTVDVLSPLKNVRHEDLNDWSIVLRVTYGKTAILLTGDAEAHAEEAMLANLSRARFAATVLCLGHHGSSTSTTDAFLRAVNPSLVIASVGAGNSYGHPHAQTLEKLRKQGIPLLRTDESGTIHIYLSGEKVQAETEK